MKKKFSSSNDQEIDLSEIFQIIWDGRLKLFTIIFVSIICVLFYNYQSKNEIKKSFIATTQILPINTIDESRYRILNNSVRIKQSDESSLKVSSLKEPVNVFIKISRESLLTLFIETISDKLIFKEAILKYGLINANQYSDEKSLNKALDKFISKIKINKIINQSPSVSGLEDPDKIIVVEFEYYDRKVWNDVLNHVNNSANAIVKEKLTEQFKKVIKIYKLEKKNKLQDVSTVIDNKIMDYETESNNRIAYLEEQSELAKALGIKQNTIGVQTFGDQNRYLTSVMTDSPFYLRGYEAIDKEIELMKLRTNKKAFISGLPSLERSKRAIEQDKSIERLELIFNSTPLGSDKVFSAALVATSNTSYLDVNNGQNKKISILVTILASFLVGLLYVIISNKAQSRRVIKKK